MNTPAQCSLGLVPAAVSTRTVILRRGPSRQVRCILWDRADDSFEDGQWLKGVIRPEDCSLSPDGRHMIYLTGRHDRRGADVGYWYTVICRPPWLTALALYGDGLGYGQGGRFLDDTRYVVYGATGNRDRLRRAEGLEQVFEVPPAGDNTLGFAHADGRRVNFRPADLARLRGEEGEEAAPDPLAGYRTEGGRLYQGERLIRDLTDMAFAPLRAPYDPRRDGDDLPWHPLDGAGP
ncbi:hypothetical protein GE300_17155 [Rhodobacteraceae bacterium 2CG4]|uniref:Uncharacterized protein n=1 Tax=Halovulum marinum TaxID=2662447 RepID=A0A6L5Z5N3_9RHOB|nr:hypothetical protein [Halovulum marinum]MSU91312.1 hypothetical protein [Halovulum marinum]